MLSSLRNLIRSKYFYFIYIILLLTVFTSLVGLLFRSIEHDVANKRVVEYDDRCKAERNLRTRKLLADVFNEFERGHNITAVEVSIRGTIRDVDHCLRYYNQSKPHPFNYIDSLDILVNIFTTVGYGDITPFTTAGRFTSIVFAIIAIPLYMMFSMEVSEWANYRILALSFAIFLYFRYFFLWLKQDNSRQLYVNSDNSICELLMQMFVSAVFLVTYMLFVSTVVSVAEVHMGENQWSITEAAYYVFISVALIGFGDMIGTRLLYLTLYLPCFFVGQVLLAVFYSKLVELFRRHMNVLRYGTSLPMQTMLNGLSDESITKFEKHNPVLVKPIIANMSNTSMPLSQEHTLPNIADSEPHNMRAPATQ